MIWIIMCCSPRCTIAMFTVAPVNGWNTPRLPEAFSSYEQLLGTLGRTSNGHNTG